MAQLTVKKRITPRHFLLFNQKNVTLAAGRLDHFAL
jgi:hypothetical protein